MQWFHDTVYCIPVNGVNRKLENVWKTFLEGRKRLSAGQSGKAVDNYKVLAEQTDKLFDIRAETTLHEDRCESEWGVTMSQAEHHYYEDQKSARQMHCDRGVDPVWYQAVMRRERERMMGEQHRQQIDQQFQFKDIREIDDMLSGEGVVVTSTDTSMDVPPEEATTSVAERGGKKRKLFVSELEEHDISARLAHVRDSERKVRDSFYLTVGNLVGRGMSLSEACMAVVEVGNRLFERKWKLPVEDSELYDLDTLPAKSNIRTKLNLIEAETCLSPCPRSARPKRPGGRSTSRSTPPKRGVGQFATQGIHIGRNVPIPLPLMGIAGETTEDIALQIDFGM